MLRDNFLRWTYTSILDRMRAILFNGWLAEVFGPLFQARTQQTAAGLTRLPRTPRERRHGVSMNRGQLPPPESAH